MLATSTYHASDGPAYAGFLGRWTRLLAPQFLDFAQCPLAASLLDVGTGTGRGPVGTYVAKLTNDMLWRIEDAVRRAFCSGSPDGERSLTATAWAVRGTVV